MPLNSEMGFQSQCGSQLKETFAEVGRGKPYLGNQRPGNGQTTKGANRHVTRNGH
jgi:hypothetical protein